MVFSISPLKVRGHSISMWTEFCHLTSPPAWTVFISWVCTKKETFFDPLHLSSCQVVIEWSLSKMYFHFHHFLKKRNVNCAWSRPRTTALDRLVFRPHCELWSRFDYLTEAGAYAQLPKQSIFFYHFQTNAAIWYGHFESPRKEKSKFELEEKSPGLLALMAWKLNFQLSSNFDFSSRSNSK